MNDPTIQTVILETIKNVILENSPPYCLQMIFGLASILGLIITFINLFMLYYLKQKFKNKSSIDLIIKNLLRTKESLSSKSANNLSSDLIGSLKNQLKNILIYKTKNKNRQLSDMIAEINKISKIDAQNKDYIDSTIDLIIIEIKE